MQFHAQQQNKEIRSAMKNNSVYMWQLSEKFNVHETTLIKWLRTEFSEERKEQALQYIREIAADHEKEMRRLGKGGK